MPQLVFVQGPDGKLDPSKMAEMISQAMGGLAGGGAAGGLAGMLGEGDDMQERIARMMAQAGGDQNEF